MNSGVPYPVIDNSRPIFRPESLERHAQARPSAVVRPLRSPTTLFGLWALLGILLAGGAATLFLQIPDYASGTAWALDQQSDLRVVAVFTPEQGPKLRPGQILHLSAGRSMAELTGPITVVETTLASPEAFRRRFNRSIDHPVAVVLARVAAPPGTPLAKFYRVRVCTGAKRIASVLHAQRR